MQREEKRKPETQPGGISHLGKKRKTSKISRKEDTEKGRRRTRRWSVLEAKRRVFPCQSSQHQLLQRGDRSKPLDFVIRKSPGDFHCERRLLQKRWPIFSFHIKTCILPGSRAWIFKTYWSVCLSILSCQNSLQNQDRREESPQTYCNMNCLILIQAVHTQENRHWSWILMGRRRKRDIKLWKDGNKKSLAGKSVHLLK